MIIGCSSYYALAYYLSMFRLTIYIAFRVAAVPLIESVLCILSYYYKRASFT